MPRPVRPLALAALLLLVALAPASAGDHRKNDEILQEARGKAMGGDLERALVLLGRAMENDPTDARPLLMRAELRMATGKRADALADIDEAVKREPASPEAVNAKAGLLLQEGKAAEALAVIDAGLAKEPASMPLLQLKGGLLFQQGKTDEVAAVFHAMKKATPDVETRRKLYMDLARIFAQKGRWEDAYRQVAWAIREAPVPPLYRMRMQACEQLGDWHGALRDADRLAAEPGPVLAADAKFMASLPALQEKYRQKVAEADGPVRPLVEKLRDRPGDAAIEAEVVAAVEKLRASEGPLQADLVGRPRQWFIGKERPPGITLVADIGDAEQFEEMKLASREARQQVLRALPDRWVDAAERARAVLSEQAQIDMLMRGDFAAADPGARRSLAIYPSTQAYRILGESALMGRRYAEARRWYALVRAVEAAELADDPMAYPFPRRPGEPEKAGSALRTCERLERGAPVEAERLTLAADDAARAGRVVEASEHLRKALDLDSKERTSGTLGFEYELVGVYYGGPWHPMEERVLDEYAARGRAALARGDVAEADRIEKLEEFNSSYQHAPARYFVALQKERRKEVEEYAKELETVLSIDSRHRPAQVALAKRLEAGGKKPLALALYDAASMPVDETGTAAAEAEPLRAEADAARARLEGELGAKGATEARFAAVKELWQGSQVRWPRAIEAACTRLLATQPRNAGLLLDRGHARAKLGAFDAAVADGRKAMEIDPGKALAAWERIMWWESDRGRDAECIEAASKALELKPGAAPLLAQRARAALRARRWEQAAADARKAIDAGAPALPSLTVEATALIELGKHDAAIASLTTATGLARDQGAPGYDLEDLRRRAERRKRMAAAK